MYFNPTHMYCNPTHTCIVILHYSIEKQNIIWNNNSYEDKMIKNVSIKCNIEDIKYINKYNDYYIVIDDNSLYLIDSNYKIISEMDKNLLYENTKNYDIIYRNGKLLYSDDIYKDGNLIYRYYDIYSYEMIDEILIGGN